MLVTTSAEIRMQDQETGSTTNGRNGRPKKKEKRNVSMHVKICNDAAQIKVSTHRATCAATNRMAPLHRAALCTQHAEREREGGEEGRIQHRAALCAQNTHREGESERHTQRARKRQTERDIQADREKDRGD